VAFQDGDDVVLNLRAALGRNQYDGNAIVDPAGNRDLHEIRRLRGERFHDPRMSSASLICAEGNPTPQRET